MRVRHTECKRETHFNIEAKLAVMIGGDTYEHQVTVAQSTLHTHKDSESTHICTGTHL